MNFYDEAYFEHGKGYSGYRDDQRFQTDADMLVRLFNPASVLEVGCAKGYLVKALRDRGIKAYGIDVSEYAISQAPDDVADYLYVYDVANDRAMRFPKVDLVVSFDTFEHIPQQQLDKVFMFMQTHGQDWFVRVGTTQTPNWEHDPSHITMHRLTWWQNQAPWITWEESK